MSGVIALISVGKKLFFLSMYIGMNVTTCTTLRLGSDRLSQVGFLTHKIVLITSSGNQLPVVPVESCKELSGYVYSKTREKEDNFTTT